MRKIRNLFIPDSALPEARWNPGAAKASDCEVSKSFCALARRCYEARHSLEAALIDVCSEAETHRLCCGRVAPRVLSIATAESGIILFGNRTGHLRRDFGKPFC